MLHMLKEDGYPEGYRYWPDTTADLTAPDGHEIGPEELSVQLRRVLNELRSDGYGVECYLVKRNGRRCVRLSTVYDESYAADPGKGHPEPVKLTRGRAKELGAERLDLHVVFAEDVDQWKAGDPFTEIWMVMLWDVGADAFHGVAD